MDSGTEGEMHLQLTKVSIFMYILILFAGLSNLNLQLSCNSSVLNVWTTAPLIITGHTDPTQQTLQAAAPSAGMWLY